MAKEEKELRAAVIEILGRTDPFKGSNIAKSLLEELNQHPEGVTWVVLARKLFVKKKKEEKAKSSSFRSLLYRVRRWLEDAYADPASPLQQFPRLEIREESQRYSLRFAENGTRPHLTAFWKPYLVPEGGKPQIQTADRFFLRLGDHFYFRDIRSPASPNWVDLLEPLCAELGIPKGPFSGSVLAAFQEDMLSEFSAKIAALLSSGAAPGRVTVEQVRSALLAKFSPDVSRHYVSAGEAVALTYIAELFQSFNKAVVFGNRMQISPDTESANIVQVGKPGAGELLSEILNSRRLRVSNDCIQVSGGDGGQSLPDHLRTHADDMSGGDDVDRFKYALVTRCPHPKSSRVITSVIASHGRVTEAACVHLTSEVSISTLFNQLRWKSGQVPSSFQIVLKARVSYGKGSNRTTATILGAEPEWCYIG